MYNISQIENIIGVKSEKWIANCYYISTLLVKYGVVEGKAVFGKYHGYVNKKSPFYGNTFINHGWVETPNGEIIDPTRWVFESKEPYIYESFIKNIDYDRGSNVIKKLLKVDAPSFNENSKVVDIENLQIEAIFKELLKEKKENKKISIEQLIWVGSLSLGDLNYFAKPLFAWYKDNALSVFIPVDNFETIMEG